MPTDKTYNINNDRLVIWQLAIDLRKTVFVKWMQVLLQPFKTLHADFMSFRESANYKLAHNSQVVLLEKVLNDHFDNAERRINITNSSSHEPVWFYEPEDNKPVYFYEPEDNKPVYFHDPEVLTAADADFIVSVPGELKPATDILIDQFEKALRAQIDYYKLYSKTYKILYI